MKKLIPMNFIISTVSLSGALLFIKFPMKINLKDFFKKIGIFSMRDLKTGLFVFISIIVFLQVADIVLNLFLEHSLFKQNSYYHNFTETRILPIIDMFDVGYYEKTVLEDFYFMPTTSGFHLI